MKYLISVFLLVSNICSAQEINPRDPANTVQNQNRAFIKQITANPLQKAGKYFLNEDYVVTDFYTRDHKYQKNIPSRYDIYLHHFEVVINNANFRIPEREIERFNFYDVNLFRQRYFVNIDSYKHDTDYRGFLEVIENDSANLFKLKAVSYYKGTASPSVITGGGDEKIKVFEHFFFNKGERLYKIKGGKKRVSKKFAPFERKVLSYIKTNKLKLKKRNDLVKLIRYYNTLLK